MAAQDQARPVFHFHPPARWMNDVCAAFFHAGFYHIFYQFNPWEDDKPGDGTGWGHARSRDLVEWEFLPPVLLPSQATGDRSVASGSAYIRADGVPMLFFTHTPIEYPEKKREAWAALAEDEDLMDWRRVDIGLAAGKSGVPESIHPRWADMFVFDVGERVFATFKQSDGLVCEARNGELTSWQAIGNLGGTDTNKSANTGGVGGECPNLFTLQDRQVLIRSTYPISYMIGNFDPDAPALNVEAGPTILDYGYGGDEPPHQFSRGLYGTTVFIDSAGRTVLAGWVSGFKTGRGWNGCMSLPRVLKIKNNRLIQTPLPELRKLRRSHTRVADQKLESEVKRIAGVRGNTLEIVAEFARGTAARFGLKVCCNENGGEGLPISYAAGALNVAGTEVPLDPDDDVLKLHLYLDRSVMELFIQEGAASVTRVDYSKEENLSLFVFAEGGNAVLESLDVWHLSSIWYI